MTYVDGFVFVIEKKNINAYKKLASDASKIWKKHGALSYFECKGDDLYPKHVQLSFPKLVKLRKDETVWFSFITYKNKTHRNKVNARVMKDPYMNNPSMSSMKMPFDMKRMSFGGFKAIVEAK